MAPAPQQNRFDRDALVISAIAFAFGGLFCWALIDPPMAKIASEAASASVEKPDLPAWVQAVGSVIAILVAVTVPLRVIREEARIRQAEQLQRDLGRRRSLAVAYTEELWQASCLLHEARCRSRKQHPTRELLAHLYRTLSRIETPVFERTMAEFSTFETGDSDALMIALAKLLQAQRVGRTGDAERTTDEMIQFTVSEFENSLTRLPELVDEALAIAHRVSGLAVVKTSPAKLTEKLLEDVHW